jgi:hypothetical protein
MENTSPKSSSTPVLDLLRDPKHWHKGTLYQNEFGERCQIDQACSFCLVGAVQKAHNKYGIPIPNTLNSIRDNITKYTGQKGPIIAKFNDDPDTTHEDIIKILEAAQV